MLTIPEGLTNQQVWALFIENPHIDTAAHEKEGFPAGIFPEEGWLYPETYHFSSGTSVTELINEMHLLAKAKFEKAWRTHGNSSFFSSLKEAVILASIVEKEAGHIVERPMVAGVFLNRLQKGMRLQADPTVVYAVSQGKGYLSRPLTKADLKTTFPHNTYAFGGLPPTAIANPSVSALMAVLQPAQTKALYFVVDGLEDKHLFATTLADHNRNVAAYRKALRQAAA